MVGGGSGAACIEGCYLLMVAYKQKVGGCREFFGGVGVVAFDVVGNVRVGGAYVGVARVGHCDDHALFSFPLDEGVEGSSETVVRHDEVVQRCVATDRLAGGESLEDVLPHGEAWRIVAAVHLLGGGDVNSLVLEAHGHGGDKQHLARDGVVGKG